MIEIPSYINDLLPYKPGKSSDPADFSRYKAILSSNENNYGPSPLAVEAIKEQLKNIHLYPDPQGAQLVNKLALLHNRPGSNFVLANGLDGLLFSLFKAFTKPGDHILTNEYSFVAFNKFAAMYAVQVNKVPSNNFRFDIENLPDFLTDQTKIIYLCNPNNPTGEIISSEMLEEVISSIPSNILVIVDEAYFDYAKNKKPDFPDSSLLHLENVLTLRTFSKLYGLAGLRIGYGIGHIRIIEALKKVKLVFNPNSLAQVGALAALDDFEHVSKTLDNNSLWLGKIKEELTAKNIRSIDSYANFVCAIFPSMEQAHGFFDYMDHHGVLLRKLDGFGMPNGIRISIGNHEEMLYFSEVLNRF